MNNIRGYFYKGIGKTIEFLTNILIYILNLIVVLIDSVKKLLGIFSLLFIFVLLNPILLPLLLMQPWILGLILVLFVVPLLGKGLISYLKYVQYFVTEFFYDRADYYLLGRGNIKKSFSEYANEYINLQHEKQRREAEKRAREQQRIWEEMFREYYQQRQNQGYDYRGYGGYSTGQNSSQDTFYNPTNDFISKYEESCKILGLSPTTDVYEIKLAYRKMAKKYHPDINQQPDATAKFQKINEAYEFLSEANIQRYTQLKGN